MQYNTKRERLVALTEAWTQVHRQTAFETTVVARWAYAHGLYPVPKRGDPAGYATAWEEHLLDLLDAGPAGG